MSQKANKKYQTLRADLIKRGTNLRKWAAENHFPPTTVYQAASGTRAGVKSANIRQRLEKLVQQPITETA